MLSSTDDFDSKLKEFATSGCQHQKDLQLLKKTCSSCAEQFGRKCLTQIQHPDKQSDCLKYFVAVTLYDKYCPKCFEVVKTKFRY